MCPCQYSLRCYEGTLFTDIASVVYSGRSKAARDTEVKLISLPIACCTYSGCSDMLTYDVRSGETSVLADGKDKRSTD